MLPSLPERYEPIAAMGEGGGGAVWSVLDRLTGKRLALKLLHLDASREEHEALVREAVALSGLEGLGAPRVLRFGRLPESQRAYLVRELVEGTSLAALLRAGEPTDRCLDAVVEVADELTLLHRAGLLHGDVKPANVIVADDGRATLVDLGLSARMRAGGARAEGLTLGYAAPELLEGATVTVRSEVYALGATLRDVLDAGERSIEAEERASLSRIVERALARSPFDRHPSADEFASDLKLALGRVPAESSHVRMPWAVVGLESTMRELLDRVESLAPGAGVVVLGGRGSGRTTLLQRLAWTLGIRGRAVVSIEAATIDQAPRALDLELSSVQGEAALFLLVDDIDRLDEPTAAKLAALRLRGARLIVSGGEGASPSLGGTLGAFELPCLEDAVARELIRRAAPALGDSAVARLLELSEGRPGPLRRMVLALRGAPVVSASDVDRLVPLELVGAPAQADWVRSERRPRGELSTVRELLERGRFDEAERALSSFVGERSVELAVLRARLGSNRGAWRDALSELVGVASEIEHEPDALVAAYALELARANLRGGHYASCRDAAARATTRFGAFIDDAVSSLPIREVAVPTIEAAALGGLATSFLGAHDEAMPMLERAVAAARRLGEARTLSVALGSLAPALQRTGALEPARVAYEEALVAAERAGDAGTVATTRLNLAGVAKALGDLAGALTHLEAAVDMGKRSGRKPTLRQALLNLANLDLYLGRLARARVSIDELVADRDELAPHQAPQLLALEAEAAHKSGDFGRAVDLCDRCARAYEAMGRPIDAAEALLEGLLARLDALEMKRGSVDAIARPTTGLGAFVAEGFSEVETSELRQRLAQIESLLGESAAHRAALELARGRIALGIEDPLTARAALDRAIEHAERAGKRDWLARAHDVRSQLRRTEGEHLSARRDAEAALATLETIAARLPRDLREVFWDEPSRRRIRARGLQSIDPSTSDERPSYGKEVGRTMSSATSERSAGGATLMRVTQDRLTRVLEINREIAGTYDLDRLLERVTDHAVALASAERGFVLLRSRREERAGELSVHASRSHEGSDPHARFSRSVAERVVREGQPIVTTSARDDQRMSEFVSVHQLMLQSVACVPIRSRSGDVLGALYLETRMRSERRFEAELPLLVALAEQVAIAIETANLVSENERRSAELARANSELEAARRELEELLGERTAQLAETRRDLKQARSVLTSHFGYEGIVGTSDAMRKVYALIDRVKDADVSVLLTGESGTGKEVVARAIHGVSPRKKAQFLGLNCGAIPEHLLESELFGHARGAFTGADRDRKGLFREASGGTIMLDEIGEMPPKMQAGLLRVLQEKVVRPVGGAREEPVDCRVIAATHRDLQAMVQKGTFREDLFYRLQVVPIRIPPLRERIEDVPILIDHFLTLFAARYQRDRRSVSRAALRVLMAHRWPGNVRQLENVLLNAWVLSDGPELLPDDFDLGDMGTAALVRPVAASVLEDDADPAATTSLDVHRASERDRILAALTACNWNRVKAAERVGMPRRTFYRRLKEYGIQ